MKRLSLPMRVTPPPCTVPRLTVTHSRKRCDRRFPARWARPLIFQILRVAADRAERMQHVFAADARRAAHHCVRIKQAALAQLDVVANDRVGADAHTRRQPGAR
jgi:uncharacterized protein YceH (UPF0502 family)